MAYSQQRSIQHWIDTPDFVERQVPFVDLVQPPMRPELNIPAMPDTPIAIERSFSPPHWFQPQGVGEDVERNITVTRNESLDLAKRIVDRIQVRE